MNLAELREKLIVPQVTESTVEVEGFGTFRLARLSAAEAVAYARFASAIKDDGDNPNEVLAAHIELVARSIVGDGGEREFDNDEGRALLAQLPPFELFGLYSSAAKLNSLLVVARTAEKN